MRGLCLRPLRRLASTWIPSFEEVKVEGQGKEERVGLVLHGLMGNAGNWRNTMERVVAASEHLPYSLRCYLVDIRHHGESVRILWRRYVCM